MSRFFTLKQKRKFSITKAFIVIFILMGLVPVESSFGAGGNFIGKTDRPLRYKPSGTDFIIENGAEFFNRPLYGTNTAFRSDGGDKPDFTLYLPGRGGNLRLGLKTATGQKWLFDAEKIITTYRPGSLLYEIRDPMLGGGVLHLTALAMSTTEGLIIRADLRGTSKAVDVILAYGGVNGVRGRRDGDIGTDTVPMSQYFQLKPEYCRDNSFIIEGNGFKLRSKPAAIVGLTSEDTKLATADALNWNSIPDLLASADKKAELPVIVGQFNLKPNRSAYVALQRIAHEGAENKEINGVKLPSAYKAEDLPSIFNESERHRLSIAEKLSVDTPDPYINAAVGALLFAADAVWDEPQGAVMHGAVAWRSKLLGWRGGYWGDALGWHDRARRHFTYWAGRQNTNPIPTGPVVPDASANFARNEPALHTNGDISNSHYDMNIVYVDALFRHFLWTGDLEFARQVWPVIERHLKWEQRLFRRPFGPNKLPLYEAYVCIWASDDLQYHGGGATHSTAYNYYHNKMAARMAKLLGKDSGPYEQEADLIKKAMQSQLWLQDKGWYAEWKDLLGLQLTHPSAAVWTFYHAVDSEAVDPFEAWQMTRFVDTQIAHIPVSGPGVPKGDYHTLATTTWMPYAWSINNVVMAEVGHTALGYWQTGRNDAAFQLFKGSILDSMFMGLCPGNVGMATYYDMARGESQRDFADGVGVTSRTIIEGLFGVTPNALDGEIVFRPGFPSDWNHASLRHADFNVSFRRDGLKETYKLEPRFSKPMALRLKINALRESVAGVTVNGRAAKWNLIEDNVGMPDIEIVSEAAATHEIIVKWKGQKLSTPKMPSIIAKDETLQASFGASKLDKVFDPQNALKSVNVGPASFQAVASGSLGHRTVFAKVRQGEMAWWSPVTFEIRPAFQAAETESQDNESLRFTITNNTSESIDNDITIRVGGETQGIKKLIKLPAFGKSEEITLSTGLVPGSNAVVIDFGNGKSLEAVLTNWKMKADNEKTKWDQVNITSFLNDKVTQIFKNEYLSPRSPYVSLAMPKQGFGTWALLNATFDVDDTGLRAVAANAGGKLMLPQGIPFQTSGSADAKNIAFTSQWDNYPREIAIPLEGKASHVYLLMAGSTNPMQSRFDNGEVIITYADGFSERLALHNPTTWWPIDQDYFIDDFAFRRPEPVPPRVDLKTGTVRVFDLASFKGKGGVVPGGAATTLDLPLNSKKELKSLTVRTLANEVVIGLMAATLVRDKTS